MKRRLAAACLGLLLAVLAGCGREPTRPDAPREALLAELAAELDPTVPGLGEFFRLWGEGRAEAAERALLAYFRRQPVPEELLPPLPPPDAYALQRAEEALAGVFRFQGVRGEAREQDGTIDWSARGPRNDREWTWFLHRHGYFRHLLSQHEAYGRPAMVEGIGTILLDWFWQHPPPEGMSFSGAWRALEVARRSVEAWLPVYAYLREDPALGNEALLALLVGVARHAEYLREHHHFGGNHLVTEMAALATLGAVWPEFREAAAWRAYAAARGEEALADQVYPDGAYAELANHYQWIAGQSFQRLENALAVGAPGEAGKGLREGLEAVWDYYAGVVRPSGTGPLNNDSDLEPNARQLRPLADRYERPDWAYIASGGDEGRRPAGPPGRRYPWAGQAVLRSGWQPGADWLFFDAGPFGSAHQHADRLHLSAALGGRDYLVDSGRYVYRDDSWSRFFRSPAAHNVPLFDRHERVLPDRRAGRPNEDFAVVEGPYPRAWGRIPLRDPDTGAWTGEHRRAVVLGNGWVWVVDEVHLARPDRVRFRWGWHPAWALRAVDGGEEQLWRVMPAGGEGEEPAAFWQGAAPFPPAGGVRRIRGEELPRIQGWYSAQYNQRRANAVLLFPYDLPAGVHRFSWLLVEGSTPRPAMERGPGGAFHLRTASRAGPGEELVLEWRGNARVPRWSVRPARAPAGRAGGD